MGLIINSHRPHIPTAKYTPAPSHVKPPSQSVLEKKEVDVTPPVSSRHHTQNSGKAAPRDKTPIKKQSTAAVAPPSKKSKSPEKVIPKRPASPAKTVEKKRDEKGKRKEDEKKAKKEATKEKKDSSERKAASPSK